ncbi:MAG: hypothetical protein AB2L07_20240 [Thermoanaerobaculaceae bacterium]
MRLFVAAFRLAGRAQVVAHRPLPDVIAVLVRRRGLPRAVDPAAAWAAACRGCCYRARWRGGLDTCLVRALVAGTLMSDRSDVVLHVGFRPDPGGVARADGHAWLAVGAATFGLAEIPGVGRHETAWSAPMRRKENGR